MGFSARPIRPTRSHPALSPLSTLEHASRGFGAKRIGPLCANVRYEGETKTEAVTQALRERLQRVRRARAKRRLADELGEVALHCSALPVRDPRNADEVIGYDEN